VARPDHEEAGADYIGAVIDGRFKIVRRLAKGGMAHVFLAKDPTRRCLVALKLLHRTGPDARRRFEAEAQVLSNFQHPHVVRAIAYGHTPDGQPYMALEYLEGESLSQRLARSPLPWREAAELGAQVAGALHALHRIGVIHRDIKPDNIMLATGADRAVVKVLDLGLASVGTPYHEAQQALFASQVTARHKTQVGWKIGTPAYLPPEAGLCDAEPRLDVYSLGVTLYQLCTQDLPGEDFGPLPDAPADLSRLLRAAIEPDAEHRLPTADHLRRGLEALLAVHPRTPDRAHLFAGCYDRLELLNVGANAAVFRGSDRELEREVALKVLREAEPSEDALLRFRRAAKILSAVRHPNIPRIFHFGVDQGQRFTVTELCAGAPASDFARPGKQLRLDETLVVGGQLASALAAVHAAGVVYRDLHVGNVLIERTHPPRAWIYDFDQSQVSPEFYARLTGRWATPPERRAEPANETPLGRMDYAAPEVQKGAAFTAASDVYALGLLLYRLLTGLRPFAAGGGLPVPARKVCPTCSPGLERLLLSMLDADPRDRPTLAAVQVALADELAELEAEREAELEAAREAAREVEHAGAREREAARELAVACEVERGPACERGAVRERAAEDESTMAEEIEASEGAAARALKLEGGGNAIAPTSPPSATAGPRRPSAAPPSLAAMTATASLGAVLAEVLVASLLCLVIWQGLGETPVSEPRMVLLARSAAEPTSPAGTVDATAPLERSATSPPAATSYGTSAASTQAEIEATPEVPPASTPTPARSPDPSMSTFAGDSSTPAQRPKPKSSAQSRSRPVASETTSPTEWDARIRRAEADARRCLTARGVALQQLTVTIEPGNAARVRGFTSSSPETQCVRAALERFGLRVTEGQRMHTFFAR
jgi:serine/threonine protein kinase